MKRLAFSIICAITILIAGCNNPVQRQDASEAVPQVEQYLKKAFHHEIGNGKVVYFFIPTIGCHGCIQSMLINAPALKQKKDKTYEVKIALLAKDQGSVNMTLKKHPKSAFDFIDNPMTADLFGMVTNFPVGAIFENKQMKKYYVFNGEQSDSCWKDMMRNL